MIHQFKLCGYNVVLDVFSGSIHLVDEPTYDVIAMYETANAEDIIKTVTEKYEDVTAEDVRTCLSDIEELKKRGQAVYRGCFCGDSQELQNKQIQR